MKWYKTVITTLSLAESVFLGGCASDFTKDALSPPQSFQSLGTTTGSTVAVWVY